MGLTGRVGAYTVLYMTSSRLFDNEFGVFFIVSPISDFLTVPTVDVAVEGEFAAFGCDCRIGFDCGAKFVEATDGFFGGVNDGGATDDGVSTDLCSFSFKIFQSKNNSDC